VQVDTGEIYRFIQQYPNGITLDEIAKAYRISPKNAIVLILLAELLESGKVRTYMKDERLYCVAVATDVGLDSK
jgi:hypothetical protein